MFSLEGETTEFIEKFKLKVEEYHEKFGEYFPTMSYDNEDIIEFMDSCIKKNKPYKPKYNENEDS
ncbi:MAG: hypothetical protein HFJ20_01030 [Clostridia bacterium]|nr:hypothetical protein [Clostridia bacterium]